MKILLASLIALVTAAWGWDAFGSGAATGASLPWLARQEGLYLTGLLSIALMSLAMLLAARPAWLEGTFGGLDRMYRCHKWAGILAIGVGATHWLIEMSDDVLRAIVGRTGRPPKEHLGGTLEALRDLAKDMGEWAIYLLLVMLVLALWKRFPYRPWRLLHKAMPVIYLVLAFHGVLLAPPDYWTTPPGWLLGFMVCVGAYGSVSALTERIGRARQTAGTIAAVERVAPDVTSVCCQLGANWHGHRPGQFALVTFDRREGAHPFTIASSDHGDGTVCFQIKALGDYTRGLAERLQVGQPVTVEGPYGRFDISRLDVKAKQIWVAGGIGITPFLAWLESLQTMPEQAPAADLHYCTRDRESDPFIARLHSLCARLPSIHLHIHGSQQGEFLNAADLVNERQRAAVSEVWFCGPQGLADSLKTNLRGRRYGTCRFHQEAFEIR